MRNLPREPVPGYDRVAVRVPAPRFRTEIIDGEPVQTEVHTPPIYRPGQRTIEDHAHGQITRDPEKHEVVTWGPYYQTLHDSGHLETVGLLQPGACASCRDLPWTLEHGVRRAPDAHHPACPGPTKASPPDAIPPAAGADPVTAAATEEEK